MSQAIVRRIESKWDTKTCILWFAVTFDDNHKVAVGIPLAHVVLTFANCLQEAGIVDAAQVGDIDTVEGFGSWLKKTVRKVTPKPLRKTVDKALSKATSVLNTTAKLGAEVVKSKYTGYLLAATAAVAPAIGGPALAAQQSARMALIAVEDARRAAKTGIKTAQTVRAIAKGANVKRAVGRLVASNVRGPKARLAIAALKSVQR